ncbi:MAG: hypothetical protein JJLCMIEE_02524 [Acidimicrobiales bacterium]|nr:MAG: ABC transporter [Actinomycetota bacterium]MBV6509433.1 hypothetical protein [Acidimicrobiales bacterium]RIK06750.1 MAG: ABC transporter [Acidobacteriota bacterium]
MTALTMVGRVVERQSRVYRRVWRGSVFSAFLAPLMFLAAIGLGLGGLVDKSSGEVDGLSYLVFVTPGLLAASVMQTATGESLWPIMAGTKWLRTFHGMLATPLGVAAIFGGHVTWVAIRIILSSSVFLAVAALLGGVVSAWAPLAIPAAVLTAVAFAAPLSAYAATQDTDLTFGPIMRLVVQPLFLFSGTFFPVEQLPSWLQPLAALSPLWHGVELCRAATTGQGSAPAILVHVLVLLAVIAAGSAVGVRTFKRRLAP